MACTKQQQRYLEICRKYMAFWKIKWSRTTSNSSREKWEGLINKRVAKDKQRSTIIQEIYDMFTKSQKLQNYTKIILETQCQQILYKTMTNWTMMYKAPLAWWFNEALYICRLSCISFPTNLTCAEVITWELKSLS